MRSNAYILMPELLVRLVSPRHPRHAHLGRGEASRANQSYLFGGKWGAGDVKYEDLTDAKRVWSATDRRWLYPIPTNERTLNNNLTQNPGWEQ